jgi:hypothetical protein
MKNRYIYLVLFWLSPVLLFAQKNYKLQGYLAVPGGESFNYRIAFTDSLGVIDGYSLTYKDIDTKETKAWIQGSIDRKNKTLTFKETGIAYNHGFETNVVICLVDAVLKYEAINKGHILTGPIVSKDAGNAYCGGGSITFVNDDELQRLFADDQEKKDSVIAVKPAPIAVAQPQQPRKPIKVVYDTIRRQAPVADPVPHEDRITSGDVKVYEWESDTLVLDIWDGGHIDGDVVSVWFNGKAVLNNYTLTKDKKRLSIPLVPGIENILTIVAGNEGNEAPNTANLLLTDAAKNYPVIAYNEVGKKAIIRIKKK